MKVEQEHLIYLAEEIKVDHLREVLTIELEIMAVQMVMVVVQQVADMVELPLVVEDMVADMVIPYRQLGVMATEVMVVVTVPLLLMEVLEDMEMHMEEVVVTVVHTILLILHYLSKEALRAVVAQVPVEIWLPDADSKTAVLRIFHTP